MSIFWAILALSFLIFFHELGHFLVARFFGVRVEVFSIGFGKKLITKTIGNTQYALSLIPLGGYVKMKGQDDSNPLSSNQESDSYTSKPPFERICILLAGPLFNILLAFFIYCGLSYGQRDVLLPVIGGVVQDMPAQKSGLKVGDKILSINGAKFQSWNELASYILHSQGKLTLQVQRGEEEFSLGVIPNKVERKNIFGESKKYSAIGITPAREIGKAYYGVGKSLQEGLELTWQNSTLIFEGIKRLIIGKIPTSEVGGVVSIVQVMHQASQNGFLQFLSLVALISINLGILNLLPIPALDGGHIVFNLYELIIRKAPSEVVLYYLTMAGWAILLSLMLLGLYNDFNRILG